MCLLATKVFFGVSIFLSFVVNGFSQSQSDLISRTGNMYKVQRIDSVASVYLVYVQQGDRIMKIASSKDSGYTRETIMVGKYYNLRLNSYLDESKIAGKRHIAGIMVNGVLIELEGDSVIWDLFSCNNLRGLSIIPEEKEYLVITFSRQRNKLPQHGVEEYYWIAPVDSITGRDFEIYPFFIDGVASNEIDECRKGNIIDPFVLTMGDSFDYDSSYEESVDVLSKIINEKRIKVQEIRKTWNGNYKEKVIVYVTPVKGNFCNCMLYRHKRDFKYEGMLFIPDFSIFKFSEEFKASNKMKFVKYFDFSTILFRFHY